MAGVHESANPYHVRVSEAIQIASTGHIPEQPQRLTRRKRHLVVAADRCGTHATVWYIRRGRNGEPVDETIRLELTDGNWAYRGGGGGEPGADVTYRPTLAELEEDPSRQWVTPRFGQIPFGRPDGASWGPNHATVRFLAAAEAAVLEFSDREPRQIAHHGYCLVAYHPKQPPTITGLDRAGKSLGSFTPARRHVARRNRFLRRFERHSTYGGNGRWAFRRRKM